MNGEIRKMGLTFHSTRRLHFAKAPAPLLSSLEHIDSNPDRLVRERRFEDCGHVWVAHQHSSLFHRDGMLLVSRADEHAPRKKPPSGFPHLDAHLKDMGLRIVRRRGPIATVGIQPELAIALQAR